MKFSVLLRIVGIVLGILAAVSLAHSGLGIRFREDFLPYLDLIEEWVGGIVQPFEWLIVRPLVHWLHEQGLDFELHDHWRNVFVLLWLFNASYSGAFAPLPRVRFDGIVEIRWRTFAFAGLSWTLAALVALIGGTLAGTVPLGQDQVFWWPIVTFFLFVALRAFLAAYFQNPLHSRPGKIALVLAAAFVAPAMGWIELPNGTGRNTLLWWPVAAYFVYAAALVFRPNSRPGNLLLNAALLLVLAVVGATLALALGYIPMPGFLALDASPSPGLASLAAFVAILGTVDLLSAGFWTSEGRGEFLARWFSSPKAQSALRILFVLGSATIVVWLARA